MPLNKPKIITTQIYGYTILASLILANILEKITEVRGFNHILRIHI